MTITFKKSSRYSGQKIRIMNLGLGGKVSMYATPPLPPTPLVYLSGSALSLPRGVTFGPSGETWVLGNYYVQAQFAPEQMQAPFVDDRLAASGDESSTLSAAQDRWRTTLERLRVRQAPPSNEIAAAGIMARENYYTRQALWRIDPTGYNSSSIALIGQDNTGSITVTNTNFYKGFVDSSGNYIVVGGAFGVFNDELVSSVVKVDVNTGATSSIVLSPAPALVAGSSFFNAENKLAVAGTWLDLDDFTQHAIVWNVDTSTATVSSTLLVDTGATFGAQFVEDATFDSSGNIFAVGPVDYNSYTSGSLWKIDTATGGINQVYLTASNYNMNLARFYVTSDGTSAWSAANCNDMTTLQEGIMVWNVNDFNTEASGTFLPFLEHEPGSTSYAYYTDMKIDAGGNLWVLGSPDRFFANGNATLWKVTPPPSSVVSGTLIQKNKDITPKTIGNSLDMILGTIPVVVGRATTNAFLPRNSNDPVLAETLLSDDPYYWLFNPDTQDEVAWSLPQLVDQSLDIPMNIIGQADGVVFDTTTETLKIIGTYGYYDYDPAYGISEVFWHVDSSENYLQTGVLKIVSGNVP